MIRERQLTRTIVNQSFSYLERPRKTNYIFFLLIIYFSFFISQLDVPKYSTPFGPIVDRLIVPNDPLSLMSDSNPSNSFFRYDVMMGLTEIEAFHLFPASTGNVVAVIDVVAFVKSVMDKNYIMSIQQLQVVLKTY